VGLGDIFTYDTSIDDFQPRLELQVGIADGAAGHRLTEPDHGIVGDDSTRLERGGIRHVDGRGEETEDLAGTHLEEGSKRPEKTLRWRRVLRGHRSPK
jgi:hypothetical protein